MAQPPSLPRPKEAADGGLAQRLSSGAPAQPPTPASQGRVPSEAAPRLCLQFPTFPPTQPCLPVFTAVSLGVLPCLLVTFSLLFCDLLAESPSLHLILFPLCLSVSPPFSVPSPLSPLQGGGPPLTRPAGPFMARAGEADTSTQPGVGLTLGPQSSSLSPPGPCLGPLPIPLC